MIAIVNPHSGGGRGLGRWRRVEDRVREITGPFEPVMLEDPAGLEPAVAEALAAGQREFIAAGGDGSVNALVNALVRRTAEVPVAALTLGAVGLGSSNDFHKPYRRRIDGVPCRLDFPGARPHDVCRVNYVDARGQARAACWVTNASIGTTAAANWFFNHPDRLLHFLKRTSTAAGIAYAAFATILRHPGDEVAMTLDGAAAGDGWIRNLGVVKNPHFTGSLCYDSPDEPDSSRFFVHCLEQVSRPRMMLTLAGLARGRFGGRKGTWSRPAREFTVEARGGSFALEFDGEVDRAVKATFTLLPGRLKLCP
jgi:diacylglycerol kinase (ATP)